MKILITSLIAIAAALIISGCGGDSSSGAEINRTVVPLESVVPDTATESPEPEKQTCAICDYDFATYKGSLAKEEVDGLLLALNDEYLAYATYEKVNRDFKGPRPFVNIQKAEGRHIDLLKQLFEAYDLPVPENKWMGDAPVFKSLAQACEAGIAGEIANRDLYTRLFNSTKREEIITVYKALQSASEENHLPAFQRCVSGGGTGRGPGGGPPSRR